MVLRMATALGAMVLMAGCYEQRRAAPDAATSASPSAAAASSGSDDILPPIEVKAPKPSYALATLSDKQLERLVARAGWTPTVVGKAPPTEGGTTLRVLALQKRASQQVDAAVTVHCRKPGDKGAPSVQPGEAYYVDGACAMQVAARLGIRNKSADSKRLLETLLAGSPD